MQAALRYVRIGDTMLKRIFAALGRSTRLDRRHAITRLFAASGLFALGRNSLAQGTDSADDLRFPGDEPDHLIVYQLNHHDETYREHIFNSIRAMMVNYPDNIHIVVACFAEGIHVLAKKPGRPISEEHLARVRSLNDYGVEFHACGRTVDSLQWTADDIVDFAKLVPVGVADIMELQENNYAYMAW